MNIFHNFLINYLNLQTFFDSFIFIRWWFLRDTSTYLYSQGVGLDSWIQSALKSILRGTLFLNRLHDFSLLSSNSFLHLSVKSKFTKKYLDTKKISFSKADLIQHRFLKNAGFWSPYFFLFTINLFWSFRVSNFFSSLQLWLLKFWIFLKYFSSSLFFRLGFRLGSGI